MNTYISSPIPASRPNLESIRRSSSTGIHGGEETGTDNEATQTGDESDSVETLLKRLEIEKRVQFGAERMLHVIESGEAEGGDKPDVKNRISAQLSESNAKIKALETQLEKLRRATPQRPRRRQPLMNAFGNGTSAQPSSLGSTYLMSQGQANRSRTFASSSLTPERLPTSDFPSFQSSSTLASGSGSSTHQSTYSRPRPRSRSTGEDSFGHATTRDPLIADSVSSWESPAKGNWAAGMLGESPMLAEERDEEVAELLNTIHGLLLRLQELGAWSRDQADSAGWKGKQVDRGEEAWDVIAAIVGVLKRSPRVRRNVSLIELVDAVLYFLGDSVSSRLRAVSYRLLRYLVVDRRSWLAVMDQGVEWMLIRSFTRETKHHMAEKEQALRLMRCGLLLPTGPPSHAVTDNPFAMNGQAIKTSPILEEEVMGGQSTTANATPVLQQQSASESPVVMTDGMIRALVSAAENADDSMQAVCLEALMEIAVIDISRLLNSSALRVLLMCYKDGPAELCPAMTHILMYLANSPATRQHLLPQADVETILVGLTEPHATLKNGAHVEKFRESARNVGLLLKSWTGLLYLCQHDRRSIRSLVGSLRVPVVDLRAVILDLMFDVLRIKAPNWMDAFLDGRRLTVYNRTREASTQLEDEPVGDEEPERPTLVDHYISLLLLVLLDAGLLEALLDIVEEDNAALTRKSTLLIGEILRMASKILPLQFASQVQALPRLFELAMEFENPASRHVALSALSSIDSLARNLARPVAPTESKESTRKRSNSVQDPLLRGQRQVQQVKMRMGMQIDDKHFAMLINDTQVVQGRDHTKWNYDILLEVIEGPLLNPKRLEEVIKVSKFLRRLFSFFHPYSQRFSNIQRTRPNQKWVKLACTLLTTMLANPDGIRYLLEDKLLRQVVECFSELDQYAGQFSAQPLFARSRIESTLTYGYFEMIGTLTKHTEGMKLLEKFRVFTCFYHLSELRSRDDIIRATIENFDYAIDGHQRIVLSKALTSNYMETRLFATHTLGNLLDDPNLSAWALRLMLTQLYDPAMEVCDAAVLYLEEACAAPETLEMVVNMRPSLEHLGEVGHPLFMRFVSTAVGFSYLHQAEYIDRELDDWFLTRNLLYVVEAETFVSKTLCPISTDTVEDYWFYEGTAPTHFYGEITKTAAGCQTLRDKGHFAKFAEVIRDHGLESEDAALIDRLKSVLWAVGNIGSTTGGLPFLEEEEILGSIVEIAEESRVLTVKGTCFFVLGLISSTEQGSEILEEYGWIATRTPMGYPTGICLPADISKFVAIEPWQRASRPALDPLPPPDNELEIEVMTAISNLANYMLSTGAMNWLKRLRKDHAHLFSSASLFYRAIHMISSNHYRAPVRSFIFDLFDIKLSASAVAELAKTRQELGARPKPGPASGLLTVPKPVVSVSTVGNGPPGRSRALTVSSADSTEGPTKAVRLEPRTKQVGFAVPSPDVRKEQPAMMDVGAVMG